MTPSIPPTIYRRFAIVTVALAAGLAMFADGEDREAQAAQVAGSLPAERASPVTLVAASPTTTRRRQADPWGDFDASSASSAGGSDSGSTSGLGDVADAGYPSEQNASLSEAERAILLRGLQENGMLDPEI